MYSTGFFLSFKKVILFNLLKLWSSKIFYLILTLINFIRVSLFSSPLGKYCSFFTGTEKESLIFNVLFLYIRCVFSHYNLNKMRKAIIYKILIIHIKNKLTIVACIIPENLKSIFGYREEFTHLKTFKLYFSCILKANCNYILRENTTNTRI